MILKALITFVIITVLIYLGLCIYLYGQQRKLIYFPVPNQRTEGAQALSLKADELAIRVWQVGTGVGPALIYFGGNAEDVTASIGDFKQMLPGYTVYLLNYRGYGESQGLPSEAAIFSDALALYDMVKSRHSHISVMGRSLGTGVAIYLASQRPNEHLVLVTPYDSIENLAKRQFPYMPISMLLKDKFASVDRVARLRTPTLALIAENDELIPHVSSDTLLAAFRETTPNVVNVAGVGHNTIQQASIYRKQVAEFLASP